MRAKKKFLLKTQTTLRFTQALSVTFQGDQSQLAMVDMIVQAKARKRGHIKGNFQYPCCSGTSVVSKNIEYVFIVLEGRKRLLIS